MDEYLVREGEPLDLSRFPTTEEGKVSKKEAERKLIPENISEMQEWQAKLYSEDKQGLLIVLQAMDAAGKDGIIKHVMTGLNPQGTVVSTFKQPSVEELDHDYLWRIHREAPGRGSIGIFNRSHYEDVLVTRVHNLIGDGRLPREYTTDIWNRRYNQIRNYEQYLTENGIHVVKFFLHISKDEQKERLLSRINNENKNWKFSRADIEERKHWDEYRAAYEQMLSATSTEHCPWYVIPSDQKWFSRYLVSEILLKKFRRMDPKYPELSEEEKASLKEWKEILLKS
ncbi:MAG: polyphosphate kinase 2 family protein [Anaerovoracaceae bacterium]|jgi:PPK2 family polyphosphate:nucleotide phosphotransferase